MRPRAGCSQAARDADAMPLLLPVLLALSLAPTSGTGLSTGSHSSIGALQPRAFEPVQLHEIAPHGWALKQLQIQANGLSGVLDKFWPQVSESVWIGRNYTQSAGGERATYWLNGQLPLSHLLANADPTVRDSHSLARFLSDLPHVFHVNAG